MKTEKEIRSEIAKIYRKLETEHRPSARYRLRAEADTLRWVLGEGEK